MMILLGKGRRELRKGCVCIIQGAFEATNITCHGRIIEIMIQLLDLAYWYFPKPCMDQEADTLCLHEIDIYSLSFPLVSHFPSHHSPPFHNTITVKIRSLHSHSYYHVYE